MSEGFALAFMVVGVAWAIAAVRIVRYLKGNDNEDT